MFAAISLIRKHDYCRKWFPRSCLLRTSNGDTISWWKGTLFIPNLSRRECVEVLVDHALTLSPLIEAKLVDGFFFDSVGDLTSQANHLQGGQKLDVDLSCSSEATCTGTPSTEAELAAANARWVANQEWYFQSLRNRTNRTDLILMMNDLT